MVATMTNDIPTPEEFKSRAKTIRKFMIEKYDVDVSHSHRLELAAQLSDFKDWNTAVAASKSKGRLPTFISTVGNMMKVLAKFDPSKCGICSVPILRENWRKRSSSKSTNTVRALIR